MSEFAKDGMINFGFGCHESHEAIQLSTRLGKLIDEDTTRAMKNVSDTITI